MVRQGGNTPANLPLGSSLYRTQLMQDSRTFDAQNNIPVSQRAKYHIPNWILFIACLPPSDMDEGRNLEEIQSTIQDLEYPITEDSLYYVVNKIAATCLDLRNTTAIQRETVFLIGGIQRKGKGVYCLGIDTKKLQKLVDANLFVTYSFNLDESNNIRLLGGLRGKNGSFC